MVVSGRQKLRAAGQQSRPHVPTHTPKHAGLGSQCLDVTGCMGPSATMRFHRFFLPQAKQT